MVIKATVLTPYNNSYVPPEANDILLLLIKVISTEVPHALNINSLAYQPYHTDNNTSVEI